MSRSIFERLFLKYGDDSHSFMGLYGVEDYRVFGSDDNEAVVAYVDTGSTLVCAGPPIGTNEAKARAFRELRELAAHNRKKTCLLPLSSEDAVMARNEGYGTLLVGHEPVFDLRVYDPKISRFPSAKQLHNRGAKVLRLNPDEISPVRRAFFDKIVKEWLDSRKMGELEFMNKVSPWAFSEHKRYFKLRIADWTYAFIAAIPYPVRKGWFLIDVMRDPISPNGTTELLILESMRMLKEEGALEVSLGVSPLSKIDQIEWDEHPKLYPVLHKVFTSSQFGYGFKSLYDFKAKFEPTGWRPRFLAYSPKPLRITHVTGVLHAFMTEGFFGSLVSAMTRSITKFGVAGFFDKIGSSKYLHKKPPADLAESARRAKFTIAMILFLIVRNQFFLLIQGKPHEALLSLLAFDVNDPLAGGFARYLTAPFLHFDMLHLTSNLVLVGVFCGLMEILGGLEMTIFVFFTTMLLTPLLSVEIIFKIPHWLGLVLPATTSYRDVGISLAAFGCAGGLAVLLQKGRELLIGLVAIGIAVSILERDPLQFDHSIAAVLGYGMALIWLRYVKRKV